MSQYPYIELSPTGPTGPTGPSGGGSGLEINVDGKNFAVTGFTLSSKAGLITLNYEGGSVQWNM